jgi:energy-coupling factor transport system ATP-binding protein
MEEKNAAMPPVVKLENVSYFYPQSKTHALHAISMEIGEGEFIALMGQNGAGKTSFCKLINGVIPHSLAGRLEGRVWVDGIFTADSSIAALASRVAVVLEDPDAQLFTGRVRDEIAFGPENLLVQPEEIKIRVSEALEAVGLCGYGERPPVELSGGQKQRLAIAAALAMKPRVLVLDEPTSQLDPLGASEVLLLVRKLRDRGMTVIMATHNSDEVAEFADNVCILDKGRVAAFGTPSEIFSNAKLLRDNWIRPPDASPPVFYSAKIGKQFSCLQENIGQEKSIWMSNVSFSYDSTNNALEDINLSIGKNEFVAIIGHNGSGKTTLLKCITGLLRPTRGDIFIYGKNSRKMPVSAISADIGFVMQNPDSQLFADTVFDEAAYSLKNAKLPKTEIARRVDDALAAVGLLSARENFPQGLSRGDRHKLVIASVLAMGPKIMILDEPSSGQDYRGCKMIMDIASELHRKGHTIIFVTHNISLATEYAQRIIVMEKGRVVVREKF